jgi:hypothetical protein
LIVCFVISLVALVPMSIREIWQENWNRVAVLGEETVVPEDEVFEEIETEVYTQAEEMPADEEIIDEVWDESWQMGEDEIVLPNAN